MEQGGGYGFFPAAAFRVLTHCPPLGLRAVPHTPARSYVPPRAMQRNNADSYQLHTDGTDLACENVTGKWFLERRQMIGTKSNNIAAALTLSVLVTMLAATQVEAGVIGQTKYTCDDGTCVLIILGNPDQYFDELVIDWSTEEMSGSITAEHLTDLTFTLSNAGEVIYQDQAIINSLPQPISGGPRALSDIEMSIDLDIPYVSEYNNILITGPIRQFPGTGTGINLTWAEGWPIHVIDSYSEVGGVTQTQWNPSSATTVTTIIPEPATAFLFGMGLLAGGSLRRRER